MRQIHLKASDKRLKQEQLDTRTSDICIYTYIFFALILLLFAYPFLPLAQKWNIPSATELRELHAGMGVRLVVYLWHRIRMAGT